MKEPYAASTDQQPPRRGVAISPKGSRRATIRTFPDGLRCGRRERLAGGAQGVGRFKFSTEALSLRQGVIQLAQRVP